MGKILIPAQKQKVWGPQAVANFAMGGAGTGLYLLGVLLTGFTEKVPFAVGVVGPGLAGLGLLILTTEAGRPERGHNLLRNLKTSWMSREALAAGIFIICGLIDWLFPVPALRVLALLGAFGMMFSQGMMPYKARGVTAWAQPIMPLLFLTCGFAAGSGLFALAAALGMVMATATVTTVALVAAVANLVVWLAYINKSGDEDFTHATRMLRSGPALGIVVGAGHVVPIVVLAALVFGGSLSAAGLAIAGILMVVGASVPKAGIVLHAGYLRPIRLGPATVRAQFPQVR